MDTSQLVGALSAHISLYNSSISSSSSPLRKNPRTAILRWFASLSLPQRQSSLTVVDSKFTQVLVLMVKRLRDQGHGFFILLPDLLCRSLPSICFRRSHGLLARSSVSGESEISIARSIRLFSSTEGTRVSEKRHWLDDLDSCTLSVDIVSDVDRFVTAMDDVSNREFLRGEVTDLAAEWLELPWLKAKGYYSLEAFVVNRLELALRLSWMNSVGVKRRSLKAKEKASLTAGVAANVFWRKKGCLDWWDQLDPGLRKKILQTVLGKMAKLLVHGIRKEAAGTSRDGSFSLSGANETLHYGTSSLYKQIEVDGCSLKSTHDSFTDTCDNFTNTHDSLLVLREISSVMCTYEHSNLEKDKLFWSTLSSLYTVSGCVLTRLREFLMVISSEYMKLELLGFGTLDAPQAERNNNGKDKNAKSKRQNPILKSVDHVVQAKSKKCSRLLPSRTMNHLDPSSARAHAKPLCNSVSKGGALRCEAQRDSGRSVKKSSEHKKTRIRTAAQILERSTVLPTLSDISNVGCPGGVNLEEADTVVIHSSASVDKCLNVHNNHGEDVEALSSFTSFSGSMRSTVVPATCHSESTVFPVSESMCPNPKDCLAFIGPSAVRSTLSGEVQCEKLASSILVDLLMPNSHSTLPPDVLHIVEGETNATRDIIEATAIAHSESSRDFDFLPSNSSSSVTKYLKVHNFDEKGEEFLSSVPSPCDDMKSEVVPATYQSKSNFFPFPESMYPSPKDCSAFIRANLTSSTLSGEMQCKKLVDLFSPDSDSSFSAKVHHDVHGTVKATRDVMEDSEIACSTSSVDLVDLLPSNPDSAFSAHVSHIVDDVVKVTRDIMGDSAAVSSAPYFLANKGPFSPDVGDCLHEPDYLEVKRATMCNGNLEVRRSEVKDYYTHDFSNSFGGISYEWPPSVAPIYFSSFSSSLLSPATGRLHFDVGCCPLYQSFLSVKQQTRHTHPESGCTQIQKSSDWSLTIDTPDIKTSIDVGDENENFKWIAEEESEINSFSGQDYNKFFGGGVMFWNSSDHGVAGFSRPPSLSSEDSSWAWCEADINQAVDDIVGFSNSYTANGLASPTSAPFCSPFDPLGSAQQHPGYLLPGNDGTGKDVKPEERASVSLSSSSGGVVEELTSDMLPCPILRPIVIPNISGKTSGLEFKGNHERKSPCVRRRQEMTHIKRPMSPVVLCVPRASRPPLPSFVSESRKQRGFPAVRSGSSSPRNWGMRSWFPAGTTFEENYTCVDDPEIMRSSLRTKGMCSAQMVHCLPSSCLQDHLITVSQVALDQEHPDVALPLQPSDSINSHTCKSSLAAIYNILHDEIESFCKKVSTKSMIKKPYINWAVQRVARALQVLWPRSRANVFGSNATGLALPTSDVDLVVCLPPVRNLEPIKEAGILEGRNGIKETCLQHAARYLANQEWVMSDSLKIIENTAIPVIMLVVEVPCNLISSAESSSTGHAPDGEAKLGIRDQGSVICPSTDAIDEESQQLDSNMKGNGNVMQAVRIDISFKSPSHTGLQTTELVNGLISQFPAIVPLALILKQFLADRSLDHPYSGGLSSYCLVLLIVRFLQHVHHLGRPIHQNLGCLLMDFLYFFGNVFDPRQMGILIGGSGAYTKRERVHSIDPIHIDDPLYPTNNVGRNCFRIHQCIKAFADAYAVLEDALALLSARGDEFGARRSFRMLPRIIPGICNV